MQPPNRTEFAAFSPIEAFLIVFVWSVIEALRTSKGVNWRDVVYELGSRWSGSLITSFITAV
jgi:hypothetical protein